MQDYLSQGRIVPAEITVGLLDTAIRDRPDANLFLIDGFPRNLDNYHTWYRLLPHIPVLGMMLIDVNPEVMRSRMLSRGQGRDDDNEDTFKRRIHSFEHETLPVVEQFEAQRQLLRINGDGTQDEVFSRAIDTLTPLSREGS